MSALGRPGIKRLAESPYALAALAGLLYFLSFPPYDAAPLGWVALVPFIAAVRRAHSAWRALLCGVVAAVVMCFGVTANVREIADVPPDADPVPVLLDHFRPRLDHARSLGVDKVVVAPGMGFYYGNLVDPITRARHQARVLLQGFRLRPLGVPVCNAVPHSFDLFGDEFRKAEGFFGTLATLGGTHLIRTHEPAHLRVVLRSMAELDVR